MSASAWWVVVVAISATQPPYGVKHGTQEQVAASWTIHSGPYPAKPAAESAAAQANASAGSTGGQGGAGGSPGSADWWLVETADISRGGPPWHEVQSAARPRTGGSSGLAAVRGPYTKAEADAALSSLQDPAKAIPGVPSLAEFLGRLEQASTWIRVAEVLLGLGLIIVGMAKLASGTAAGKAAIKAGKAAAIL